MSKEILTKEQRALREIIFRAVHDEDFDIDLAAEVACEALGVTVLDVVTGKDPRLESVT